MAKFLALAIFACEICVMNMNRELLCKLVKLFLQWILCRNALLGDFWITQ